MENKEYTQLALDDAYEIIIRDGRWRRGKSRIKSLQFLDKVIEYFEDNDEFEKCAVLREVRRRFIDEFDSKIKKKRK